MHPGLLVSLLIPLAPVDLETALPKLARPAEELSREAEQVQRKLREAGLAESRRWSKLRSREEWIAYRDPRIEALRRSLGSFPPAGPAPRVRVQKTHRGEGYLVECVTFTSRPGLEVTANLYRPEKPGASMPGLLLVHSHHNPKWEGELQDMGILWARAGCVVLVPDLLGHGERRQHPFRQREDYPQAFRTGRQDYYFRYNLAVQLQTVGESLMGWICWDLMRGVDVLLAHPGVDRERIAILGSVAGGGDPAAVTAALDPRIGALVAFNFGGPQPETRYPLPSDAETSFFYTGSGSWESTRNLALSAREGFLPWVVVGSVAPRFLVYAHEFSWDEKRDPVWARLQQIYAWYSRPHHLASTQGTGLLSGEPPVASHCNNIGAIHRKGIHEAFRRWLHIEAREIASTERRSREDLTSLSIGDKPEPVHRLAARLGEQQLTAVRARLEKMSPVERRAHLRQSWSKLLGITEESPKASGVLPPEEMRHLPGVGVTRMTAKGLLLLRPVKPVGKRPVVVAVAQGGSRWFLQKRGREIAQLLQAGNAVALVDLGGTSQVGEKTGRGRASGSTALASSMLMLGQPLLGQHLQRLREALALLRTVPTLDARQISLWGDSPVEPTEPDRTTEVPLDLTQPPQVEPLGTLVVLLAALFEEDMREVKARGGLVGYASLLETPFVHVPYDAVVPGVLPQGDIADVVASLAPCPVRLEGLVDSHNRAVPQPRVEQLFKVARTAYRSAGADEKLILQEKEAGARK
ncbi:MAG: acetylxylan esterase [Gemmataceae bacterium]